MLPNRANNYKLIVVCNYVIDCKLRGTLYYLKFSNQTPSARQFACLLEPKNDVYCTQVDTF